MIITSIAAPFADNLISNGVDTTKVKDSLFLIDLHLRWLFMPLLQC